MRLNDGSARWVDRSVTVNSPDCTISFFEPPVREASTTLVPQTPDRALPSIEYDIKYESPTRTSPGLSDHDSPIEDDEVDLIPCSFPESDIKEELKEEPDETGIRLDQVPTLSVSNYALARPTGLSGIAQLQQFAALSEQPLDHQRNVTPDEETLSNSEGDLSSLLEKFDVKRGSPGNSSIYVTPPSRKRKRSNDSNLTPDRPSPTSPSSFGETLASTSAADFFREQANQLPTKHKPHEWTFEQREALCLIHMFYEVDTAFEGITRVLNQYFQCPPGDYFRPLQVRTQWSFWRYIFRKWPVYDPKHEWLHKKEVYETAAARAGVRLTLRNSPLKEKRLNPRAEKTAERVATQDAWFLGKLLSLRDASSHSPVASPDVSPLAGRSPSETEDDTIVVATPSTPTASSPDQSAPSQEEPSNTAVKEEGDTSDPPTPYRPAQASIAYAAAASQEGKDTQKPSLLYRVYHDESGGLNTPTHFRAGLFNIPGQSLEPPPADSGILPVFVSWHLWHHSVSSPFISCTDSLIMAIHKARQAEQDGLNPHLSIIKADTATAEGRGFPAYPLVFKARKRGLVPGMRYKGLREFLIWGEISQESIIYDLPFQVLRTLTLSDFAVADLLALDDIDPAPRMSLGRIRRSLLGQEVILDESTGHAIGRLVALFGLGTLSPPEEIAQFVYDLFQGWVLGVLSFFDMADEFVVGLQDGEARSGGAVVVLDDSDEADLKAGFVCGVLRAQDALKKERRLMRK